MTLKSGDLVTRNGSCVGLADLKVGQKIDGFVKRIEDYGLFINIDQSKLNGLCHKSQVCTITIWLRFLYLEGFL